MNLSANTAMLSRSDEASIPLLCRFFNRALGCQSSAERSSDFDFFLSEEAAFQRIDGWSERQGEFLKPEYQVERSDADED